MQNVPHSWEAIETQLWSHSTSQQRGFSAQVRAQQTGSEQNGWVATESQGPVFEAPHPARPSTQTSLEVSTQLPSQVASQQNGSIAQTDSQHSKLLQNGNGLGRSQGPLLGDPQPSGTGPTAVREIR